MIRPVADRFFLATTGIRNYLRSKFKLHDDPKKLKCILELRFWPLVVLFELRHSKYERTKTSESLKCYDKTAGTFKQFLIYIHFAVGICQ
jgi:hypothetical protein